MFGLNNDCKCVIYRKLDIGTFFSVLSTLDIRYSDLPIMFTYKVNPKTFSKILLIMRYYVWP